MADDRGRRSRRGRSAEVATAAHRADRAVEQSNDLVALPSKFLIHEWQIMHDFCLSVAPDRLRNELYDGIHGSGAFRIFKVMIRRHRLEDAWRDFRQQKLEAIAIDFLD